MYYAEVFPLHGLRLILRYGSLSQMVTVPILEKDLCPNYMHFNQGIRVSIETSGNILYSTRIRVGVGIRVLSPPPAAEMSH